MRARATVGDGWKIVAMSYTNGCLFASMFSFQYAHPRALGVMPFSLTAQAPFLTLLRSNLHYG
jgi:hypothetical protein